MKIDYSNIVEKLDAKTKNIKSGRDLVNDDYIKFLQVCYFYKKMYGIEDSDKLLETYKKVILNQRLAKFDLLKHRELKENEKKPKTLNLPETAIYCSFHYGSYRSVGAALYEKEISFSIVASKSVFDESVSILQDLTKNSFKNKNIEIDIINANDNSALRQMISSLRRGKSLLIYIDGFNGLGEMEIDKGNLLEVEFMKKNIYSRKGIAYLSYRLDVPIVPAICGRNSDLTRKETEFGNSIYPKGDLDLYQKKSIQEVWDFFSERFKINPSIWEGLLYFSAFYKDENQLKDKRNILKSEIYIFNNSDYDFYESGSKNFLYHKESTNVIPINDKLHDFLFFLNKENEHINKTDLLAFMDTGLYENLVEIDVLIPRS
jgi:lauroyl/myristoyl acyltransferase